MSLLCIISLLWGRNNDFHKVRFWKWCQQHLSCLLSILRAVSTGLDVRYAIVDYMHVYASLNMCWSKYVCTAWYARTVHTVSVIFCFSRKSPLQTSPLKKTPNPVFVDFRPLKHCGLSSVPVRTKVFADRSV